MTGPFGGPRPFSEPKGWRGLNSKEKELLIEWYMNSFNFSRENAKEAIETAIDQERIAVKDNFVADMPGYVGPMIVLLGGMAGLFVVLGIDDEVDELIEFDQE